MSWSKNTTLLLLLCLSFELNAQQQEQELSGLFYALLLKGQPAPYDTTVAIALSEYRRVRAKVMSADELLTAKNRELAEAYALITARDSSAEISARIAESNARTIETLTEANRQAARDYDALYRKATAPQPWYERPWVLISAGFIGGALLKSL